MVKVHLIIQDALQFSFTTAMSRARDYLETRGMHVTERSVCLNHEPTVTVYPFALGLQ
jgi:hypothetical protein